MTLVTITHAVDCIIYLSVLRDQSVFNFCAIPQVMAIATLALVYRNPLVFQRNIKIRRGESVQVLPPQNPLTKLMTESTNLRGVCDIFVRYTRKIHKKTDPKDPNFLAISVACGKIEQFVESIFPSATTPSVQQLRIEAEKAERKAQEMTPEEKKDLYTMYAGVALVWFTLFVIMTFVAWLFGARFDFLFGDLQRVVKSVFGGSGEAPGRVEL
jgi:farnesyl-diphosphate farnesyltransferase